MKNQDQLIVTACYCGQFVYGLSAGELWRRAILSQSEQTLSEGLQANANFVANKIPQLWQQNRQEMAPLARQKWQEVSQVISWVTKIPWIDAVFITGGLAMGQVKPGDDIDFLLVAQAHRLWLCRVLVSGISWLRGKRRSWRGNEPDSWCFNMWLERGSLAMPSSRQSIYEAYELLQAKPVWQRQGALQEWYQDNKWVEKWCPHWAQSLGLGSEAFRIRRHVKVHSSFNFLNWLNGLAYQVQYVYMRMHLTRELVTPNQAFFHPRPTKNFIVEGWKLCVAGYNDAHALTFFERITAPSNSA